MTSQEYYIWIHLSSRLRRCFSVLSFRLKTYWKCCFLQSFVFVSNYFPRQSFNVNKFWIILHKFVQLRAEERAYCSRKTIIHLEHWQTRARATICDSVMSCNWSPGGAFTQELGASDGWLQGAIEVNPPWDGLWLWCENIRIWTSRGCLASL